MKKTYFVPELKVHGSVEEITGAFGSEHVTDTIFNSDGTVRGTGEPGSRDGIIVPCDVAPDPFGDRCG
jgi:hypothetical protein